MKKCNIHVNSIPRRIPMKKIPERMNGQKLTRVKDINFLEAQQIPPK